MATPSTVPFNPTGDAIIDVATNGYVWQLDGTRTINWSLANGFFGEFWTNPSSTVASLTTAFNSYASYANIRFNYVGFYSTPSTANAFGSNITVSLDSRYISSNFGNSVWAVGFFPSTAYNTSLYQGAPGDIFLNINSQANFLPSYAPGSAGYALAIHEIGHTLGLKHPFDNGGTSRPTLESVGLSTIDKDWFSVMAYADDYNWNLVSWDPATPMPLDVLALQYLYGPNLQTNAGNSTYTLTRNNLYQTIWDASGTDVVDASQLSSGWQIFLPDVQLSSLVSTRLGEAIPLDEASLSSPHTLYWLMGDIENATGTQYADQLKGNRFANVLRGNGGNDTLDGGDGFDTAAYSGARSGYQFARSGSTWTITDVNASDGNDGVDTLSNIESAQFSDASFALTNRGPVSTPASTNRSVHLGQSVSATSLFGASDPESDTITAYRFWDGGTTSSSGYFSLNGVRQASGQAIDISTANLANLVWVAGGATGSEVVWAQASDQYGFGDWASWAMNSTNATPVVTPANASANLHIGQSMSAASLFSASDADTDAITIYRFWDGGGAQSSGYFSLNGVRQASGQVIDVAAANLANLAWVSGATSGSEAVWAQASDPYAFGAWSSWTMNSTNVAPTATPTATLQTVVQGTTVNASTLFSTNDVDGDTITAYRFWDAGTGGGQVRVNGVGQAGQTTIEIAASQLATTTYAGGASAGSETLWVQAYDGAAWSPWANWTMQTLRNTNSLPVLTAPASRPTTFNQWTKLSDIVSVTDADGDPITSFRVTDANTAAGSARLWANGSYLASGSAVTIATSDLSNIWVQAGSGSATDAVSVEANDGYGWSSAATFNLVSRASNSAPTATATATVQTVVQGTTVNASTLFSTNDVDGDAITAYRFWDAGTGGGQVRLNGVGQAAQTTIEIAASQLATTTYAGGASAGSETLWVQAYDGAAWSPWANWTMQTLRSTNSLAVVSAPASKQVEIGQWTKLSDFVSISDADGDAMASFRVTDANTSAGSARLWANGSYLASGSAVTIATSDLSNIWVQGGSGSATDAITVEANDGYGWSNAAGFNLVTRLPNRAPVATPTATLQGVAPGQSVALSTLFATSDADGDAIVSYRFWDGGAGGGSVRVNNIAQPAQTTIEVAASGLANATYAGGARDGREMLWVQAYDGRAWGAWTNWGMETYVRLAETVGSYLPNTYSGAHDTIYFGGRGDDQFAMPPSNIGADQWGPAFMGGEGGDTYSFGSSTEAMVFENGNSAGDRLEITGFGMNRSTSVFVSIDGGRHLALADTSNNIFVVVLDWQSAANRIEQFSLDGTVYSYSDIVAHLAITPPLAVNWEDIGATKFGMDEFITFYAQRESVLAPPNLHAPTVTGTDRAVYENDFIHPSELFAASDGDGDPLYFYELRLPQGIGAAGTVVSVDPGPPIVDRLNHLDDIDLHVSSVASQYVISARASDGLLWSPWTDVTITTTTPPVDGAGNILATAQMVSLSATPQTIHEFVGAPDNVDYFRFSLSAPAVLQYQFGGVSTSGARVGTTLFSLAPDGSSIAGVASAFNTLGFDAAGATGSVNLAAGEYALQLTNGSKGTFYDVTLAAS